MSADAIRERARKIFGNQGMHRNAEFISSLHPHAVEYLEQAPVLACALGVKTNTRADRLYIAMRIGGPIERGERLRSVMASVDLPYPLRKLKGNALSPFVSTYIRETCAIPPSALSQAIPDCVAEQRRWLKAIRDWRNRAKLRTWMSPKIGFVWLATNARFFDDGEAGDIVDFLGFRERPGFERWSIHRMRNEIELWHDTLNAEKNLHRGLTAETVIDLSDWPEYCEVDGFEIFKLTTPRLIMEEGRKMRHCVASYIPDVVNGGTHLFSLRRDMRRLATFQIKGQRVVQIKAFGNKQPAAGAVRAADSFAKGIANQDQTNELR